MVRKLHINNQKALGTPVLLSRYTLMLAIAWTAIVMASIAWNITEEKLNTIEDARIQGRTAIRKDILYRSWNASHGGVYVPVTERTPSNPYLPDTVERTIKTTSGKLLTLINPAYMTRQVHEMAKQKSEMLGHITSLKPIRPGNAADPWETKALQAFERGEKEVSSLQNIEGREYIRMMLPLITEKPCLKCHAVQGYKEGDIRGGISVSFSMKPFWAIAQKHIETLSFAHFLLWLIGLCGIGAGKIYLDRSELKRAHAEDEIIKAAEQWRQTFDSITDLVSVHDLNFRIVKVNRALASFLGKKPEELIGRHCYEVMHGTGEPFPCCPHKEMMNSGQTETKEIYEPKSGLYFLAAASPIFENGELKGSVHIMKDISERKLAEESLKKESGMRRALLNNIPSVIAVILKKESREIVACNELAMQMGAVIGKTCYETLANADAPCPFCRAPELWATGEKQEIEAEHIGRYWRGHWFPLTDDMLVHYIFDITEQKRAVEKLQESEERYRTLFSRAGDGIIILSTNGKLIEVNASFARMHGYSVDEMLQMSLEDLDTPEAAQMAPERMRRIMAGETLTFEVEHYHKDGHTFPLEVSASLISLHGEFYIQCFHRDITERMRAEKALIESEARYIDLYENAPDMYISVDVGTGRILQCNQTLSKELGYTKGEIVGREIFDLYHPDSVGEVKQILRHFAETGEVRDKELQVRRKDGTTIDISLSASAVCDEQGRILYSRGSWRNITDKKAVERQLLHAQKMETIGTLAGGVAHDFNNILTVIIGVASILKRRIPGEDPLQQHIDQIEKAANSAAALTKNLLTFSRKQKVVLARLNVNDIIRTQEKFLLRVIGEDIEFRTKLADEDCFVMVDFNQMEQVFMNIAANARDAMPKGGAFTISTECVIVDDEYKRSHGYGKPGDYVLISISDTGTGIDEYTRGRIFEPFFTTKEVDKGTGLGLSLVYGIIKQHNGYIDVLSGPGEGTTFRIYLPLVKDQAGDPLVEGHIESLPQAKVTETVLVAEDSAALRNLMEFVLTEAGYKVIAAENGEEALGKFMDNSDSIQLVLLDVIMPKKNGKEVYDAMKKIKRDIKVLFFSGYSEDIIHRRDIIKEGIEIIPKPLRPDVLLRKIREELDRA